MTQNQMTDKKQHRMAIRKRFKGRTPHGDPHAKPTPITPFKIVKLEEEEEQ
jgi:hypothetical protein